MRGDIVYRIYGVPDDREHDHFFGAFRTIAEAEAEIAKLRLREMNGRNWAEQYYSRGFVIREAIVQTDFEVPSLPKPRDRYFVRGAPKDRPGTWPSTIVQVFRRAGDGGEPEKVYEYERNYSLLHTFEPFRQCGREFALISPQYTGTSVLDLATGRVIAEEPVASGGFCPLGFYVPDWWDLHDQSVIPGSEYWSDDYEWPSAGDFGFVWGCVWGDDSSWKVQYLDLSGIQSGVIRREARFGYVELAIDGYLSPCFSPEGIPPAKGSDPPPFIKMERWDGETKVTLSVEIQFDFNSGRPTEWQRANVGE